MATSTATGGTGGGALGIGNSGDIADADISEIRVYNFWLSDAVVTSFSSEMLARQLLRPASPVPVLLSLC